jgi:hypothetical protein
LPVDQAACWRVLTAARSIAGEEVDMTEDMAIPLVSCVVGEICGC